METYRNLSPVTKEKTGLEWVAPGLLRKKILFVNVYFITHHNAWALVDAGLRGSSSAIIKAAEAQFGKENPPEAIFLTHGHFDHIGALENLFPHWDVPVYAHPLEFPYLTGKSNYPPADPTVGGGAMATMSWMFPNNPIDIGDRLLPFAEKTLPGFPDWQILHTPGHAPGHVSFFRENDNTLIAGDAFVTVNQEAVSDVIAQKQEVHRPPAYFTCNWVAAKHSVEKLASLQPHIAACGHGKPMEGEILQLELATLANNFALDAVPKHGRYVLRAAVTNEDGVQVLPPPVFMDIPKLIGIGAALVAGIALITFFKNQKATTA